jgi:hypothetical protein
MPPNHSLIAQLPKIGPILGWTREQDGVTVSRLWAKANDTYSGRAVLALTARWDGAAASEVRFWKVHAVHLRGTQPPALERFALGDVKISPAGHPVRMVMLHIHEKTGDEELPAQYGRAYHFQALGAHERLPEPEEVKFDAFSALLKDPVEPAAEQYATRLFKELDEGLRKRRQRGEGPIPSSLSRRYRAVPSIADCEVRPVMRVKGSPLVIAAGSCRHPGLGLDRGRADAALCGIAEHAKNGEGLDLALMLGDQIYVDAAAGVLDGEDRLEKYALRYDQAFASPGFRALTSSVPTYMLADDHEVRDSWPNDSMPPADPFWTTAVDWAWNLYLAHQRWHGPDQPPWVREPGGPRYSFWYNFEHRGYPFFAFDARFERLPNGRHIVGGGQMSAFEAWLENVAGSEKNGQLERHVPKFVLSGSVFAPGLEEFRREPERARRADNWQGFDMDRGKLAHLVAQSGLQNLVFLSGDYHCPAAGHFDFSTARGYTIAAPALYAPYPFANALPTDIAQSEVFDYGGTQVGVAECAPAPFLVHGFALIRARRERHAGQPDDWELDVELYKDSDSRNPAATALLADGEARWKP